MQYGVEVTGNVDKLCNIRTHESEPVAFKKVFYVTCVARREIVKTKDFIAFVEKTITEMRSEKPGPSSHSSASTIHVPPLPALHTCGGLRPPPISSIRSR